MPGVWAPPEPCRHGVYVVGLAALGYTVWTSIGLFVM